MIQQCRQGGVQNYLQVSLFFTQCIIAVIITHNIKVQL